MEETPKEKNLLEKYGLQTAIILLVVSTITAIVFIILKATGSCWGELSTTVNGLVGPFIGVASAILVYVSFLKQVEANQKLNDRQEKAEERNEQLAQIEKARISQQRRKELLKHTEDFRKALLTAEPHFEDRELTVRDRYLLPLMKFNDDSFAHLKSLKRIKSSKKYESYYNDITNYFLGIRKTFYRFDELYFLVCENENILVDYDKVLIERESSYWLTIMLDSLSLLLPRLRLILELNETHGQLHNPKGLSKVCDSIQQRINGCKKVFAILSVDRNKHH